MLPGPQAGGQPGVVVLSRNVTLSVQSLPADQVDSRVSGVPIRYCFFMYNRCLTLI